MTLAMLAGCSPDGRVPAEAWRASKPGGAGGSGGTGGAGGSGACAQGCGEHPWSLRFGDFEFDPREQNGESGYALATGPGGDVLLAGEFAGTLELGGEPLVSADPEYDQLFVAGFKPDGTHRWSRTVVPERFAFTYPLTIAPDPAGNTVVAGMFFGSIDFGGGPLLSTAEPVLDSAGQILPEFHDCCWGEYSAFVAKLGPEGQHVWSKRFGQPEVLCSDHCSYGHHLFTSARASVNGAGEIVLSGSFQGEVDFGGGALSCAGTPTDAESHDRWQDGFVAKLDSAGHHLWSLRIGDTGRDSVGAFLDSNDELVLVGSFEGTVDLGGGALVSAGERDLLVAKLDADGQHLWSKRFGSSAWDRLTGHLIPSTGEIVLSGPCHAEPIDLGAGPIGAAGDWIVAKLDAGGDLLWSRVIPQPDVEWIDVHGGPGGELLLAGVFAGTLDLDGEPLVAQRDAEFFAAKLAPDGSPVWSQRFAGLLVTEGDGCFRAWCNWVSAARLDAQGNGLLTGAFRGSVDFGAGPLYSLGTGDGFLAKLGP